MLSTSSAVNSSSSSWSSSASEEGALKSRHDPGHELLPLGRERRLTLPPSRPRPQRLPPVSARALPSVPRLRRGPRPCLPVRPTAPTWTVDWVVFSQLRSRTRRTLTKRLSRRAAASSAPASGSVHWPFRRGHGATASPPSVFPPARPAALSRGRVRRSAARRRELDKRRSERPQPGDGRQWSGTWLVSAGPQLRAALLPHRGTSGPIGRNAQRRTGTRCGKVDVAKGVLRLRPGPGWSMSPSRSQRPR